MRLVTHWKGSLAQVSRGGLAWSGMLRSSREGLAVVLWLIVERMMPALMQKSPTLEVVCISHWPHHNHGEALIGPGDKDAGLPSSNARGLLPGPY